MAKTSAGTEKGKKKKGGIVSVEFEVLLSEGASMKDQFAFTLFRS